MKKKDVAGQAISAKPPLTMLEYALAYAGIGWAVLPLYTIKDGHCTCGAPGCSQKQAGKHPIKDLAPRGSLDATKDEAKINLWWGAHPTANIGVATGPISGIIGIDQDVREAEGVDGQQEWNKLLTQYNGGIHLDTPEQITGGGGAHTILAHPHGYVGNSTCVLGPGVDVRGSGGYLIVEPSLHVSGATYSWEGLSDPLRGVRPDATPQWLVEIISKPQPMAWLSTDCAVGRDQYVDDDLIKELQSALEYLKEHTDRTDTYDGWVGVGMALHSLDNDKIGLAMWQRWSRHSDKCNAQAERNMPPKWESFGKRNGQTPITHTSIFAWAQDAGWQNPKAGGGQIETEIPDDVPVVEHVVAPWPEALEALPGPAMAVAQYIYAQSFRKSWPIAISSTLAMISICTMNKYEFAKYRTALNIYLLVVAQTGAGKESGRSGIMALADDLGVVDMLKDDVASGQAMLKTLAEDPRLLFMPDEFGMYLQAAAGNHGSVHIKGIMKELMSMFGKARTYHSGKVYADSKLNIPKITKPFVSLYGSTTKVELVKALTMDHVDSGFLNRFLMVEIDGLPDRSSPEMDIPDDVLASLRNLGNTLPSVPGEAIKVGISAGAERILATLETKQDVEQRRNLPTANMWARISEQAIRVAANLAVMANPAHPEITTATMEWSRAFCMWCLRRMLQIVDSDIAESPFEAHLNKVLATIRGARAYDDPRHAEHNSTGKVTRSQVARKCQSISPRDLDLLIRSLIDSDRIGTGTTTSQGTTKPTTLYWAT